MIEVAEIKYFHHRSEGIEILLTIGNVVKELTLKKVRAARCFGLITDEMTDVSVVEFMVKSLVDYPGCQRYFFSLGATELSGEASKASREATRKNLWHQWITTSLPCRRQFPLIDIRSQSLF